jgi:hypothetical protein
MSAYVFKANYRAICAQIAVSFFRTFLLAWDRERPPSGNPDALVRRMRCLAAKILCCARGGTALVGDLTDLTAAPETVLDRERGADVQRLVVCPSVLRVRGLIRRRHRIGRSRYGWADGDRLAFIIKCRRIGLSLSESPHRGSGRPRRRHRHS